LWHVGIAQEGRDDEQKAILMNMGYEVLDLWDYTVKDRDLFDDWLKRYIDRSITVL
jgi:very-short-patch-repair endonuclease